MRVTIAMNTGPYRISDKVHQLDLTGYVIPYIDGGPVLIQLPNSNDGFVPIFTTAEKLHEYMKPANIPYEAVNHISDPREFLIAVPRRFPTGERVRIIIDPWVTDMGNTRFREVLREDA